MFNRVLGCVLIAMLASPLYAAAPRKIVVWQLDAGNYVVQNGEIVPFGGEVPLPPPTPPTPPAPASTFTKAIAAEINKIPVSDKRHETALKLTATYQMLAEQVKADKIPLVSASEATRLLSSVALGAESQQWSAVMSVVNTELTKAQTTAEAAAMLDKAATAVSGTVPASADGDMAAAAKRYGFDWTTFMAFLMELLKVLLPLILS